MTENPQNPGDGNLKKIPGNSASGTPKPVKPAAQPASTPTSSTSGSSGIPPTQKSSQKTKSKKKKSALAIIMTVLSGVLLALTILLGWQYMSQRTTILSFETDKISWETEKTDLFEQIQNLNKENELLISQNEELRKNEELKNAMAENEKLQIRLDELKRRGPGSGGNVSKYKKEIEELKAEVETLQAKIKDLLTQLGILEGERNKYLADFEAEKKNSENLKIDNDVLQKRIEDAAKLEIEDLMGAGTIFKKGGEKIKVKNKVKKLEKIQICFTILKNPFSDDGMRDIHVVIKNPDGQVISKDNSKYKLDNLLQPFSIHKAESYSGKEKLICVYYEKGEEELSKGNYIANLYINGKFAGNTSFDLN